MSIILRAGRVVKDNPGGCLRRDGAAWIARKPIVTPAVVYTASDGVTREKEENTQETLIVLHCRCNTSEAQSQTWPALAG